jgi:hypothetical protein
MYTFANSDNLTHHTDTKINPLQDNNSNSQECDSTLELSLNGKNVEINIQANYEKILSNLNYESFERTFLCKLCMKVLYSPNLAKCCGESACHSCFTKFKCCPFCKDLNYRIMPNFKLQKMKEFLLKYIKEDKNFIKSSHCDTKNQPLISMTTMPMFPSYMPQSQMGNNLQYMNPQTKNGIIQRFLTNATFYIIKSINYENLNISQSYNEWATTITNQVKLNSAFMEKNVILIFSVNKSSCYQGFAIMTSYIQKNISNLWKNDDNKEIKLGGCFNVYWISKNEIKFNSEIKNMINPLNNNDPVIKSRDTQELPHNLGFRICEMLMDSDTSLALRNQYMPLQFVQNKILQSRQAFNYYSNSLFINQNNQKNERRKKRCRSISSEDSRPSRKKSRN